MEQGLIFVFLVYCWYSDCSESPIFFQSTAFIWDLAYLESGC